MRVDNNGQITSPSASPSFTEKYKPRDFVDIGLLSISTMMSGAAVTGVAIGGAVATPALGAVGWGTVYYFKKQDYKFAEWRALYSNYAELPDRYQSLQANFNQVFVGAIQSNTDLLNAKDEIKKKVDELQKALPPLKEYQQRLADINKVLDKFANQDTVNTNYRSLGEVLNKLGLVEHELRRLVNEPNLNMDDIDSLQREMADLKNKTADFSQKVTSTTSSLQEETEALKKDRIAFSEAVKKLENDVSWINYIVDKIKESHLDLGTVTGQFMHQAGRINEELASKNATRNKVKEGFKRAFGIRS